MNFMNMQYDDFITNIIKTRGQWDIPADVDYWEGHHIVPKCMGGDGKSRSKDPNIIWLLPEEHFIAHYLLCLKYPENIQLGLALHDMLYGRNRSRKHFNLSTIDPYYSAELYREARILAQKANVAFNKQYAATMPSEERIRKANCAGQGMKLKMETDTVFRQQFQQKLIERHATMTVEEKAAIYSKSSESLRKYYRSSAWQEVKGEIAARNSTTNKAVSKKWRGEFLELFGYTPEWFRKYGKLQEACHFYKQIRNTPTAAQDAANFVKACELIPSVYTGPKDPGAKSEKLRELKKVERDMKSQYQYELDGLVFGNSLDLARYLEAQYSIKFSTKLMSGLSPAGWQYDTRCKRKLKALCDKLTTEIKVIEKEN